MLKIDEEVNEIVNDIIDNIINEIVNDVIDNIINKIVNEIVNDIIDNIINEIVNDDDDKILNDVINNITNEIVNDVIDNIINKINKNQFIQETIICKKVQINNKVSFNYNSSQRYNYARYIPYYMRYVDPASGYNSYIDALTSGTEYGVCLRGELVFGNIQMFGLEEIFVLLVPNITIKDPILIKEIDNRRNEFISFCLNIEKSYLFYNEGKKTCNNIKVAWGDKTPFDLNSFYIYPSNPSIVYASYVPLFQLDQYNIYSLSVNYFEYFDNSNGKINFETILKIVYGLPYTQNDLTPVNFFQMINYTYILLSDLFGFSKKLLNGLETGLPKLFIETFFTRSRQLYYYNLYITWIQSRIRYDGFGSRINSSNGDGTFVQTPSQTIWN
jgi:hypothetical protein